MEGLGSEMKEPVDLTPHPSEDYPPTPIGSGALRKTLIGVLLVITVGSVAYVTSKPPAPPGRINLIDVATIGPEVAVDVRSRVPDEIERYISEIFSARVNVPEIEDAQIEGVGTLRFQGGIAIPTILFTDPSGDLDELYVFTYAMLDEWSNGAYLDRAIRLELEHDRSFAVVSAADGREVVLWRSGDDIYLAVAQQGASSLISRIES